MKAAIACDSLTFQYFEDADPILEDVTFHVPEGTITVLMGSSGCGKSTLASVLCGLLPENGGFLKSGSIKLFDQAITDLSPNKRVNLISMMFQNPDLQFCMNTFREELYFCLENISVPKEEMQSRAEKAAKTLGMTEYLDRPFHQLSGGQKQRAMLTCIYLLDAKCILLDEPFANLDPESVAELMILLQKLRSQGKTILAIDHMSDHWIDTADRFVLLGSKGKVIAQIESSNELKNYKALFLEQGVAYPGIWHDTKIKKRSRKEEAEIELKHFSLPLGAQKPQKKGLFHKKMKPILLSDNNSLLYHLDAIFPKGKISAILGPSGSGKTSLMMALFKQRAYEGSILIHKDQNEKELRTIAEKTCFQEIGFAFQNPSNQFITQNVLEEVLDGLERQYPNESEMERKKRALEMLGKCGLRPYQMFSPFMLSQGQQRRLAVLSVLAVGQKILLLDEPTYGQDYESAKSLMELIVKEVEENDLTVIMTTHDRGLANAYADVRFMLKNKTLLREVDTT